MRSNVIFNLINDLFLLFFFTLSVQFFNLLLVFFFLMDGNAERNGESIRLLRDDNFVELFLFKSLCKLELIFFSKFVKHFFIFYKIVNDIKVYSGTLFFSNHSQDQVEEMLKINREFAWKICFQMEWIIDQLLQILPSFLPFVQHIGMMTCNKPKHDNSHGIHITFRVGKIFFLC